ncbi:MAG: AAA family ATPase [Candidatus Latescibacteria bacterium]|nr:AAA family ATPase [Candidatus Latescibacterota bacterium]
MYLSYWGLKEKPFENTPDPRFMYYSVKHKEALLNLLYAVNENKGAALLTGDIGCGKTLLARALISRLDPDDFEIGLVANPRLDEDEFIREIMYQFGQDAEAPGRLSMMHRFNEFLYNNAMEGKKSILIIDEAQLIKNDMILEEIRLLLNFQLNDRFLLTLILIGQPELEDKLRRMPQLDQRIGIRFHIEHLSSSDTRNFILFRLKQASREEPIFTENAIASIFKYSEGIPRKINTICDLCMVMGVARNLKIIDENVVRELT